MKKNNCVDIVLSAVFNTRSNCAPSTTLKLTILVTPVENGGHAMLPSLSLLPKVYCLKKLEILTHGAPGKLHFA